MRKPIKRQKRQTIEAEAKPQRPRKPCTARVEGREACRYPRRNLKYCHYHDPKRRSEDVDTSRWCAWASLKDDSRCQEWVLAGSDFCPRHEAGDHRQSKNWAAYWRRKDQSLEETDRVETKEEWRNRMLRRQAGSALEDLRRDFQDWCDKGVDVKKFEGTVIRYLGAFSPLPGYIHREIKPAVQKHLRSVGELQGLAEKGLLPPDLVRRCHDAARDLSDYVVIGLGKATDGPGAPSKDHMYEFAVETEIILRLVPDRYKIIVGLLSFLPGGYQGSPESLRRELRRWKAKQRYAQGMAANEEITVEDKNQQN